MKRLHAEPAGNTVRFRCAVDGNPKPQVLWYKNDLIVQKNDRVGGYKVCSGFDLYSIVIFYIPIESMFCSAVPQSGSHFGICCAFR